MAKRRSLNDALSPEQEAFLETGRASGAAQNPEPPTPPVMPPAEPSTSTAVESRPEQSILPPVPSLPDAGLQTLNVRIEPSIVGALLRASMVRKIQRQAPHTQREIVSEALRTWLKKHGYYDMT